MKIRNGFVSNSSSSSFILIPKDRNIIKDETDKIYDEFIDIDVVEEDYNRGRNELLSTVAEKTRFFISMSAIKYNPDYTQGDQNAQIEALNNYFDKMDNVKRTLYKLLKKHNIDAWIHTPPVHSYLWADDEEWDNELKKFVSKSGNYIRRYSIDIGTENNIYSTVADLINDEAKLESFLFDKRSFAIVGGDEYYYPLVASYIKKKEIDYEYERVGDYNDHEAGEKYGDGPDDVWEYAHHWGEYLPESCKDKNGNIWPELNVNCTNDEIEKIIESHNGNLDEDFLEF